MPQPDLFVEFLRARGLVMPPLPPNGEQLGHLGHELLLPVSHMARVEAKLAGQLCRRPVPLAAAHSS